MLCHLKPLPQKKVKMRPNNPVKQGTPMRGASYARQEMDRSQTSNLKLDQV